MDQQPKAFSTPKHVHHLRGRPSIREHSSIQSPIELSNDEDSVPRDDTSDSEKEIQSNDFNKSPSDSDSYLRSEGDSSGVYRKDLNNRQFCNCLGYSSAAMLAVIAILIIMLYGVDEGEVNSKKYIIEDLEKEFPTQVNDFWISIKVAISEINRAHRPKSIILVYQSDATDTLNRIISGITLIALCELTSCSLKPLIIAGEDLNTTDILEDYGKIIARNKEQLQERGVMVINNMEKIPGVSAQAFHSLCDEFNPVIEKALFLFTMKVDAFQKNIVKLIENQLRSSWSDLDDDRFYPLFTRISDVVLPVTIER
ncbi:Lamina-associated polypeptide 1C [Gonioctena quinquepunctata]|nr:Lamina-associated polypeptide 1C [Gonioctena quinquepunctata]